MALIATALCSVIPAFAGSIVFRSPPVGTGTGPDAGGAECGQIVATDEVVPLNDAPTTSPWLLIALAVAFVIPETGGRVTPGPAFWEYAPPIVPVGPSRRRLLQPPRLSCSGSRRRRARRGR